MKSEFEENFLNLEFQCILRKFSLTISPLVLNVASDVRSVLAEAAEVGPDDEAAEAAM